MEKSVSAKKIICLTGATGFVGQRLARQLLLKGYSLRVLTRDPVKAAETFPFPAEFFKWDPLTEIAPSMAFNDVEAVIHLAGESVAAGRWTRKRKIAIMDSRSLGSKNLVQGMKLAIRPTGVLISASAIGFYGDRGEEELTEESEGAQTFLARVCRNWEEEVFRAKAFTRTVVIRIGIVLGTESGALAEMLPIFRLGLGGPIGNGQAWMSWIHVDDLVQLFIFALENEKVSGVVNGVSPNPSRNADFTRALAQSIARPAIFPVPSIGLKLIFGEMANILLASQKVIPRRALEWSFEFKYTEISPALKELLAPKDYRGAYELRSEQFVPSRVAQVFDFFSEARNLETLTPPWLNFKIVDTTSGPIHEGTLIRYRLRVRGLPIRWKTLIKTWNPNVEFVDQMLKGPYQTWDHTHTFHAVAGGVLVSDRVFYRLPMGIFGNLVAAIWVNRDIKKIFNFRRKKIGQIFQATK